MNLQKYTQKSTEALQSAQSIMTEYGNREMQEEHLLLALMRQEEGIAPELMKSLGVSEAVFNAQLEQSIGTYPKVSGGSGELYLSESLRKALEKAEKEASLMGDEYVSVEHLILGIIEEPSDKVKKLFSNLGIEKSKFLEALKNVRGNRRVTSDHPEDTYDVLKKYGTDLVELAKNQKLDPVIGRDEEIRNVIRILSRKTKNNPCLIGEPEIGRAHV